MFEVAELGQKLAPADYDERAPSLRERLLDAQFRLKTANFSVIIVIAGVEGAGKGETVNLLLEWMDARGIASHALGKPSDEEQERPEFYRFWRQLPPKGTIGIFFGSWYTNPLVDYIFGRSAEPRFEHEMNRIMEFERMLTDEGTLLLKFWLHISKKQQRRRFKKLEANPHTAWRVTRQAWKFHRTYDDFVNVCSRALRLTNTGFAPWNIIEAWDRRFRHLTVAEKVCAAIEHKLSASAAVVEPTEPLPIPAGPNVINTLDLGLKLEADEYQRKLEKRQGKLGELARCLGSAKRSAVVVFEGSDAAGKGGCIRRVIQALDARFYRVIPIAAQRMKNGPSRICGVFGGICRDMGTSPSSIGHGMGGCLSSGWNRFALLGIGDGHLPEIDAFEEQLIDAGVVLIKFWLAISPAEQARRFHERESTGYKRYKLTSEDVRNREKSPMYEAAACEMIAHTSTEVAPWTVVEAEDKHYARVKVLDTIVDRMERVL